MFESEEPIDTPAELRWKTIAVPRGEALRAFTASAPVGVYCHFNGQVSKPCTRRITKGVWDCEACLKKAARFIAYQPLYLYPTLQQVVVIVSKTVWPKLNGLTGHSPVSLSLAEKGNGPVRVLHLTPDELGLEIRKQAQRRGVVDIRRYLLHLWQMPELTAFFVPSFDPNAK